MIDGVANDDAVLPGALLAGRYRVVEPIGSGGMARVFLARDEALGRPVAVKVLRPELTDSAASDRAAIETRLLASLNHPGLVTLFDAHLNDEPRFLVMEHVVGMTLSQRIAAGVLDDGELTALGSQLADALHVVHDAGIVHRDVKPSNILLARSTVPGVPLRAKLADFGIAHLLDSDRVTSPSLLIGTAAYIAPELLHGADPAPPSDIYALGLVLVEAATGERAFAGSDGNRGQLLARLSRDPDMPMLLDHRWRDLLCAMTSRRPEDRPTALEVMSSLSRRAPGTPVGAALVAAAAEMSGHETQAASRAAQADVATATWPVTASRAIDVRALDAPVPASAAVQARGPSVESGTEPMFVGPSVPAAAARASERRPRSRRRRRQRTAITVGAVSIGAIGVALAAHLMLAPPPTPPTTDVPVPAVVETPAGSPTEDTGGVESPPDEVTTATETVVSSDTGDVAGTTPPADTTPAETAPADTTPPETIPAETVPVGVTTVDPPAGHAEKNGSARGSNSGNGNGPGANSGKGPSSPGSGKPENPGG